MALPVTRRPPPTRAGDVYELVVEGGFSYLQTVAKHREFGWAMRVLAPVRESVGMHAEDVVRDAPEMFVALMGNVALEAKEGRLRFVGHTDLPTGYDPSLPLLRASSAVGDDGRHLDGSWWLDDGRKEWHVGSLTKEQQRLPYRQFTPALALRVLIDSGWDPQWEFKGPDARQFQKPPRWKSDRDNISAFFLLFPNAGDARRAADAIAAEKRIDTISLSEPASDDNEHLFGVTAELADVGVDDFVELEEYFEGVASRFAGVYDGNEVPVHVTGGHGSGRAT